VPPRVEATTTDRMPKASARRCARRSVVSVLDSPGWVK
jgi:hypothetical protein